MSTLHLDSLEIKNFRCFEHLVIEKLGRVNLIVGKNSVGKSCLLEAFRLFADRANLVTLLEILGYRNETDYATLLYDSEVRDVDGLDSAIKYLFYSRQYDIGSSLPVSIGAKTSPNSALKLSVLWYSEEASEEGKRLVGPVSSEEYDKYEHLIPRIAIHSGNQYRYSLPLRIENRRPVYIRPGMRQDDVIPCQIVPVNGLDIDSITTLWERVSLTKEENEIIKALNTVAPKINGINLVGFGKRTSRKPFVIVKLQDQDPIPLKSLGDGLVRAFGISLALVNSRDGFLLIDEFETGLHHSVQANIWRLVFDAAERLNVQVFATTHSWDCVEAFQEAAAEDQNEEAMLIRLQKKRSGEEIEAVLYDERRLTIATEENIEVR